MERAGEPGAGHRPWWWVVIALVILTPLGVAAARQLAPSGGSPATGSAQVVTQGIATLSDRQMAWRLVERTALPRTQAKATRRALGFIYASDEPILLTNAVPGGTEDVARLAPGESFHVKEGTRQIRASLGDQSVKYLSLELVPADEVDEIGSGTLHYKSDPFTPPTGERDLDLVRNVLELGETATVPDTGESTVILATDGAIDILPDGGRPRTLQAGESGMFDAGQIEIEAVEPTVGGAKAVPVAAMTNRLAQDSPDGAAYVVAVIGEEIPPPPTPTPTPMPTGTAVPTEAAQPTESTVPTETPEEPGATETATKEATEEPTATPTEEPQQTGSIAASVYNCPPGMTAETLVGDACDAATDGYDLLLTTPGGETLTLADASGGGNSFAWRGLDLGEYGLVEDPLPPRYDDYFIPGSAAVGGSSATGYTVTIDESAPDIRLTVYNFQPRRAGSVAVQVFGCPSNDVPNDDNPANCAASAGSYDFRLAGSTLDGAMTGSDTAPIDGGFLWADVPFGAFGLRETAFTRGFGRNVVPGYPFNEGLGGFEVDLGEGDPDVTVEVFNFIPG